VCVYICTFFLFCCCVYDVAQVLFFLMLLYSLSDESFRGWKKKKSGSELNEMEGWTHFASSIGLWKKKGSVLNSIYHSGLYWATRHRQKVKRNWKKTKNVSEQTDRQASNKKSKTGFSFFFFFQTSFLVVQMTGGEWRLQLPYRYQDIKSKRRVEHFILLLLLLYFVFFYNIRFYERWRRVGL
jgi:hypothetical protein